MKRKISVLLGVVLLATAGLAYAAGHANHGTMTPYSEADWQEIAPGSPVSVIVLWGDPHNGESGRLIKLPAGFSAPIHAHNADYHGINLTGTWRHSFEETGEVAELPPGSYVNQPGPEWHGDSCLGPEDCIIFLHMHQKINFIPRGE